MGLIVPRRRMHVSRQELHLCEKGEERMKQAPTTLSVRIPAELKAAVYAARIVQGISLSEYVQNALIAATPGYNAQSDEDPDQPDK
jgi:predicted HicB family RNase H-like nuclease